MGQRIGLSNLLTRHVANVNVVRLDVEQHPLPYMWFRGKILSDDHLYRLMVRFERASRPVYLHVEQLPPNDNRKHISMFRIICIAITELC